MQPTNEELEAALASGDVEQVARLREKRTTWFGSEWFDLRVRLDEFLNERQNPNP